MERNKARLSLTTSIIAEGQEDVSLDEVEEQVEREWDRLGG